MAAGAGREPHQGWLSRLVRAVFQSPLERERDFYRRLRLLNTRISDEPDSLTHRVLRGEMYLERREYERAAADFEKALALTEKLDDAAGWLIVEQVMRDRALAGLRIVEQKQQARA